MSAGHAYGYEGDVEQFCPVEEIHRAGCECGWTSDDHDDMDWEGAEQEAVEHVEEHHMPECDDCGAKPDHPVLNADAWLDNHESECDGRETVDTEEVTS